MATANMFKGVVHGNTIELEREPGLPDGQAVSVEIRPITAERSAAESPPPPWWLDHLDVDPSVRPGKFVVKGTRLLADTLVEQLDKYLQWTRQQRKVTRGRIEH